MNLGGKIPEMGSGQRIVNSDHSPEKKVDRMVYVPIFVLKKISTTKLVVLYVVVLKYTYY